MNDRLIAERPARAAIATPEMVRQFTALEYEIPASKRLGRLPERPLLRLPEKPPVHPSWRIYASRVWGIEVPE